MLVCLFWVVWMCFRLLWVIACVLFMSLLELRIMCVLWFDLMRNGILIVVFLLVWFVRTLRFALRVWCCVWFYLVRFGFLVCCFWWFCFCCGFGFLGFGVLAASTLLDLGVLFCAFVGWFCIGISVLCFGCFRFVICSFRLVCGFW